jgi:hypothetical protein
MTHRPAPHASRTPRRHPIPRGRATTGVAIAGLVAVVGSLLAAPAPAHASEAALDGARAAISASLSRGTYSEDVLSGKITVEQIVDVDLAARAAIHANATRIPTRAELIRQTTEEIADVRAHGSDSTTPELSPLAGSRPASDPLVESKHWWNRVTHWATISVDASKAMRAGAGAAGISTVIAGACLAEGAVVCSAVALMGVVIASSLSLTAAWCVAHKQPVLYVKVPDFTNSHCGY